jgi:hypothetical protein
VHAWSCPLCSRVDFLVLPLTFHLVHRFNGDAFLSANNLILSLFTRKKEFDAFVKGGAAEAEAFFSNEGEPVHCLSTRFEGVNFRVSIIGC